jgi:Fuc2NAc and GlcNAc transferase
VAFAIAAASGGFLAWNWAPAKIFMGDVGSGLLGFLFGTLAVASERAGGVPLLLWVLLLGVFVFDATVTLLRRVVRGERWYDAHRSHAYQRAVRAGWTHARVSSAVLLLTAVLGGLAAAASRRPGLALPGFLAGMALLAVVYLFVERRNPMHGGA